jgi:hypothetical protein
VTSLIHFPTNVVMESAIYCVFDAGVQEFETHAHVELTDEQKEVLLRAIEDACGTFCTFDRDASTLTPTDRLLSAVFGTGAQKAI